MEEIDSKTIQILKALGHSERVRILILLKIGKKTLDELNAALGTKGSHLFANLNALTSAQLVSRVRVHAPTWELTNLGMKAIEIYQYVKQQLNI